MYQRGSHSSMNRNLGNKGYGGSGYGKSLEEENISLMELENNAKWDELSRQTEILKGLTTSIHDEVREQNDLLNNMGDTMNKTYHLFKGTISKIGIMLNGASSKHMYYLVCFIVVFFLILYFMMKK